MSLVKCRMPQDEAFAKRHLRSVMAMTHRTLFPPPDENRALEQLERLHREILRARRDRERAGVEFDGFVQEFRERPQENAAATPAERTSRRASRPFVPAADRTTPSVSAPAEPGLATQEPSRVTREEPAIPALAAAPAGGQRMLLLAIALLLLAGAAGALYFWQRSQQTPTQQQPAATSQTVAPPPATRPAAPAPQPQDQTASPQPAQAVAAPQRPAPVSPSTVQLTTDRAVWMRVIVDGQKILEREVPAGQRLTYTPTAFISVRAGDAGGVRVKVGNGLEQVLGRAGFPLTRRFEIPRQ